jgi:hypothetical protein
MKGIGFAFDAFSQWSEHERNKMKWRMKVGIKWRPSMINRQPSPSFPLFPSIISHFSSTTSPLGQNGGLWPHGWPPDHPLAPL